MQTGPLVVFLLSCCGPFPACAAVVITSLEGTSLAVDAGNCGNVPITTITGTSVNGGTITYSFATVPDSSGGFSLVENIAILCNKTNLDTAGHTSYTMTVTGETNGETGTLDISITVTNLAPSTNQAPVITPIDTVNLFTDQFEIDSITPVATVTVTDADTGAAGNVDLSISGDAGPFALNGLDILVKSTLTAMSAPFELTLLATDQGSPPESSSVTVTFSFEIRPAIVAPTDGADITICEVDPAGTVVTELNIQGVRPASFLVKSGPDIYVLDGTRLKLAPSMSEPLSTSIDYETKKDDLPFLVEISVYTSTVTINIYIEDHNDNTPVITGTLTADVEQSSPVGTHVYVITASDADGSAPNNELTFQLSGLGSEDFSIISIYGVGIIAVAGTLSYTNMNIYTLNLTATDGGEAPDTLSSYREITITVKTAPTFDVLNVDKSITINEDYDINNPIYTLSATDLDIGDGTLEYIIVSQSSTGNQFSLTEDKLFTSQAFDAETDTTFTLVFKVKDGTYETTSGTLSVMVGDVNDNTPALTPSVTQTVAIIESTSTGTEIKKFTATDADRTSPNNAVTFSLTGVGSDKFEIDPTSGAVKTKSTLNYSEKSSYSLTVTATDGAASPNTRSASVTLEVRLETAPSFDDLNVNKSINIPENNAITEAVYTLNVTDLDNVAGLTYAIASQSPGNQFSLTDNKLFTSAIFDAEADTKSYELRFTVTDTKYTAQSETLNIVVVDVNDHTPVITPLQQQSLSINETIPPDTHIIDYSASDGDATSPNHAVTFSLTGEGSDKFQIDPLSGVVTTTSTLSYADRSSYSLNVIAEDGGTPSKSASVVLVITLKTAPRFNKLNESQSISIPENHDITNPIYTLSITDLDAVGTLVYAIVSQSPDNQFSLTANKLHTPTAFDAETQPSYELRFSVTDGEFTTESQVLTITVTDINDNKPVFAPITVNNFAEHTPVGTSLFIIQATDADITSPNNQVTYAISGSNATYLEVDTTTGEVSLKRAFNISELSNFLIMAEASDGGIGSAKQTTEKELTFSVYRDTLVVDNTIEASVEKTVKEIRLNTSCPVDLFTGIRYDEVKAKLVAMWDERRPGRVHRVTNIRCGSIVHDVTFLANSSDTIQEDMQYLMSGGTLDYGGETVVASGVEIDNITYSNQQPDKAALLCGVHVAVQPCPLDTKCAVQNGTAFCEEQQYDNFGLIIGILGAILGILFLVLVGVVALYLSKRNTKESRNNKKPYRSSHSSGDFGGPNYPLREGRGWQNSIGFDNKNVYPPYRY